MNENLVTILGAGTVVGQRARWDGTSWIPVTQGLDLIAESVDPTAAATLSITGLNGDADLIYYILFRLAKDATGAASFTIRFNADSGTHYGYGSFGWNAGGGGATVANTQAQILIWNTGGYGVAASKLMSGYLTLFAKSGDVRRIMGMAACHRDGDSANVQGMAVCGEWTDTASNLTEIDFLTSPGNMGGVGSFIRVYRLLR